MTAGSLALVGSPAPRDSSMAWRLRVAGAVIFGKTNLSEQDYLVALGRSHSLAREQGIDAIMAQEGLEALVAPTGSPAWTTDPVNGDHFLGASSSTAAMASYPIVNVNAGFAFGVPVGISFIGRAWSEPALSSLAHSFEQAVQNRRLPSYLPTLPEDAAALLRSAPKRLSGKGPHLDSLLAGRRLQLRGL